MVTTRVKIMSAGLAACLSLGTPAIGSAQSTRYLADRARSVVVECGPGQRAVMVQRQVNGEPQLMARCEGTTRAVALSSARSVDRASKRTKTKTALMIAGSAATGAGVGGALKGKKGAIVGAAIGGGSASIYEAVKRR
jgi:hypothetical protein